MPRWAAAPIRRALQQRAETLAQGAAHSAVTLLDKAWELLRNDVPARVDALESRLLALTEAGQVSRALTEVEAFDDAQTHAFITRTFDLARRSHRISIEDPHLKTPRPLGHAASDTPKATDADRLPEDIFATQEHDPPAGILSAPCIAICLDEPAGRG